MLEVLQDGEGFRTIDDLLRLTAFREIAGIPFSVPVVAGVLVSGRIIFNQKVKAVPVMTAFPPKAQSFP